MLFLRLGLSVPQTKLFLSSCARNAPGWGKMWGFCLFWSLSLLSVCSFQTLLYLQSGNHPAPSLPCLSYFLILLCSLRAEPVSSLQNKNRAKLWEVLAVQEVTFNGDGIKPFSCNYSFCWRSVCKSIINSVSPRFKSICFTFLSAVNTSDWNWNALFF